MELSDVLRTTAAVRSFTDEPVSDAQLYRVLDLARFAPSGGNRQGAHVTVVRDRSTREELVRRTEPGARRYSAQVVAGERPWSTVVPSSVTDAVVAETPVPEHFTRPLLEAAVVLVVSVDLSVVAATDSQLDRVGIVGGGSIYPLAWNILLASRQEGLGGTLTTMAVAEEPAVKALLRLPDTHAIACVLPLGHPVKQVTSLRRQAVEEFVTLETFDGAPLTTG
jgi:nitroreductase